jgi:hypothetical protein
MFRQLRSKCINSLQHISAFRPSFRIIQACETSQYVVPRGGLFLGKWRSSFAGTSDGKMNVQSACALNTRYMPLFTCSVFFLRWSVFTFGCVSVIYRLVQCPCVRLSCNVKIIKCQIRLWYVLVLVD